MILPPLMNPRIPSILTTLTLRILRTCLITTRLPLLPPFPPFFPSPSLPILYFPFPHSPFTIYCIIRTWRSSNLLFYTDFQKKWSNKTTHPQGIETNEEIAFLLEILLPVLPYFP